MFRHTIPSIPVSDFNTEFQQAKALARAANVPAYITVERDGYLAPGTNLALDNHPITWDFGTRGNLALNALTAGQEPAPVGFVINGQPVTIRGVRFNANSAAKCGLLIQNTDVEGLDMITVQNATEVGLVMYGIQSGDLGRFYVQYTQFGGTRHGVILDSCNHARIRSLRVHGYSGTGVHVIGNGSTEPLTYVPMGYGRSSGGPHIFALDCESHQHSTTAQKDCPRLMLDGCHGAIVESFGSEGGNAGIIIKNGASNNTIRRPRPLGPADRTWLEIVSGHGNRIEQAIVPGINTDWAKARIAAAVSKRNYVEGIVEAGVGPVTLKVRYINGAETWDAEHTRAGVAAESPPPSWVTEWESPVTNILPTGPRGWRKSGSNPWEPIT